jgi:isoleucyl-tRNA synthetase
MFERLPDKLSLPEIEEDVLKAWKSEGVFEQTLDRPDAPDFTFYEGPPTANGKPGIHHVMARTVKDLVCRYKTMRGYQVHRKAGWDTHGLPVEIEVERRLGIKQKDEIEKYGVDRFNAECRKSVFEYKDLWEDLTHRMGYWVDMDDPYVTCENNYIESVWWALDSFFKSGLIYQGFRIQLYCPRCGTPLSTHEVSLGYRDVDDPSVYVKAPVKGEDDTYFLVWTTTPWTLISNVALAVGADVEYVKVKINDEMLILAKERLPILSDDYSVVESIQGSDLVGMEYERWFDYFPVEKKAWYVIAADFVTTTDGSGIVHIAPAYGEDDYNVARVHDLPMIQAVDTHGEFKPEAGPFAGQFFKKADSEITRDLKQRGRLHARETVRHSYPHCWRCETPLLFYARKSWYIRTTDYAPKMIEYNKQIGWHPPEVGEGRFGNWLEENKDWAISRDRFWGTPIPIWVCGDCNQQRSVGSIDELKRDGQNVPEPLDLHKPFVDQVLLTCGCGGTMHRIPEVVDVWFDSGSMPFAQQHYPFENKEKFERAFPADFIAEGVDQTRGWFYTLHAISSHLFGEPSYRNVIVNDMVLDKSGQKMSKSKGNTVDPFEVIDRYGADAVRWFLIASSPPWKPKLFDTESVAEVQRKLFNTLLNTYSFFALYANVDGFDQSEPDVPVSDRPDIDRWILSLLHSTASEYIDAMEQYDPTRAARLVNDFTIEQVSNWYVRRNRRRFWKGEINRDKTAAYQTLFECLVGITKMMAPVAPFLSEHIYGLLNDGTQGGTQGGKPQSVHISPMIEPQPGLIDPALEKQMAVAQGIVVLVRSMRSKNALKVRQPLGRISIPASNEVRELVNSARRIILEEINVKQIEFVDQDSPLVQKSATPNFRQLGPRFGKNVNQVAARIKQMSQAEIAEFEKNGTLELDVDGTGAALQEGDLSTTAKNIEGWIVESANGLTVALDTTLTPDLIEEGIAREFVNRVQNMRKDAGLDVTDRIRLGFLAGDSVTGAIEKRTEHVQSETLAISLDKEVEAHESRLTCEIDGEDCEIGISKAG